MFSQRNDKVTGWWISVFLSKMSLEIQALIDLKNFQIFMKHYFVNINTLIPDDKFSMVSFGTHKLKNRKLLLLNK